ncbi:serine/threonine-protein kinase [Nonomuraea aurantiaca]|uniref:serine/threonine-protein kinase n=1 Tax=Nonomuraea aurantiaca TaxID=2878562 RepID=UPI001CD9967E|nr:serine/threonine-protein kinase [Nonomuraea aurantiaca]MCA2222680.1 serine/threonine protein kinase [Nonomuraea aurantiaca]
MERQVSNRYRLIEPLGEGGMGVVWRAYDELLDRTVAIKEVRYTGVGEDKRAELNRRTIREARAAGRLDHPSVIVIHDVVEEDGRPWIVMQLIRSRSLADVIREHGPLPVAQAAMIGGRVLDALRAAHATGVLHRDVKPENVLLADDGRVVLTDFGIASLEAEAGLTATGGLVGTPAYMPPERLNGEPARPESDLWSLGATLYAAVEGAPPFKRDSWAATVAAVLRDLPGQPVRAGVLGPVIMGLLHRDPAARMSADEAAHLLRAAAAEPIMHGYVGHPTPQPGGFGPARTVAVRPRRRGWLMAVPAVVIAVAALGTGGWYVITSQRSPVGTSTPTPTLSPAPTSTSSGTTSPSPTRTPEPSATPTAARLPDGWRRLVNSTGRFSIGLPEGWQAKKNPTRDSITITGPGTPGQMIVEWTVPEKPLADPERRWAELEKEIQAKGEFERYRRIGIRATTYLGRPAADWEFTRMRGSLLIHVINRGFRTADGRHFALYWDTADSWWDQDRHYFDEFVKTFRPR